MRWILVLSVIWISEGRAQQGIPAPLVNTQNAEAPSLDEIVKLRDPFRSPDLSKYKGSNLVRTELEQFGVGDFKVLGIITGPGQIRAMVMGPNQKTYFVRTGQKMGVQNGVIKRITSESIIVHEKVTNLLGNEETLVTEIRLPVGKAVDTIGGDSAAPQPADGHQQGTIIQNVQEESPTPGFQDIPGANAGGDENDQGSATPPDPSMVEAITKKISEEMKKTLKTENQNKDGD